MKGYRAGSDMDMVRRTTKGERRRVGRDVSGMRGRGWRRQFAGAH
jgi:hypothetical protein